MYSPTPHPYTTSISFDRRLYKHDIAGSKAHARMLGRQGIVPESEVEAICEGLDAIEREIESGAFPFREELEDIHMNVETRLAELIGEPAGRLHTARSRNDQVALDVRLFLRDAIDDVIAGASLVSERSSFASRDQRRHNHARLHTPAARPTRSCRTSSARLL